VSGAVRWSAGCGAHGPGWDCDCAWRTCALGDEERGAGRVIVRGVRMMCGSVHTEDVEVGVDGSRIPVLPEENAMRVGGAAPIVLFPERSSSRASTVFLPSLAPAGFCHLGDGHGLFADRTSSDAVGTRILHRYCATTAQRLAHCLPSLFPSFLPPPLSRCPH
jgi:hypothetical protein